MRIVSGIQPSGKLHLGNYFGMMRQAIDLQRKGDAYLFIANYHALTTVAEATKLREATRDVALDFLACGLDPEKAVFFRQSDVPEVQELAWILSTLTPMGLLERCHSYKDKLARGMDATHGLFAYPVLMAADILLYQANLVPVGKDQKQHLEVTRDVAIKFNNRYGEIFTIPEGFIPETVATVPGTDGQKMSKSYNNTIPIFGTDADIKSAIMGIVSDSTPLEAPKNPDTCTVYALYRLFASEAESQAMAEKLRAGGYGYGHAKKELLAVYHAAFDPLRKKREELEAAPDYVEDVLKKSADRARAEARKTLDAVRRAVGLA
ncbi:MAG: tryptophan--tRNA ligase [Kiritimatiellaeota bacterium]|nr:tryptophan--tRNA ligase [Kiritimatiellota bacterium]